MDELLSLKWNNHRSTFIHILTVLRDKQLYTDATLACDGKFYSVHRLVLSTCSDYFSAMFDKTNTCKNPIIVLKDIKCEDLESLLDYMYIGEVNVRQADLASLIKAAECLCVKGLAVPDDEPSSKKSKSDTSNVRRTDGSGSPPSKRKRREEAQERVRSKSPLRSTASDITESHETSRGNNNISGQSPRDSFIPVKIEREDPDDIGIIENFSAEKFKEELPDNDSGDPGGNINDLSEYMPETGAEDYGPDFPGTSTFQSGDGWQDDISNMSFGDQSNFDPNDPSSQNAQGTQLSNVAYDNLTFNRGLSAQFGLSKKIRNDHVCLYCGRKCPTPKELQRHIRIHTGEKPFACTYCQYRSARQYNLKIHIQTQHESNGINRT